MNVQRRSNSPDSNLVRVKPTARSFLFTMFDIEVESSHLKIDLAEAREAHDSVSRATSRLIDGHQAEKLVSHTD